MKKLGRPKRLYDNGNGRAYFMWNGVRNYLDMTWGSVVYSDSNVMVTYAVLSNEYGEYAVQLFYNPLGRPYGLRVSQFRLHSEVD